MPAQSHIARALEALETERQHLTARLEKVQHLIETMRDVFHLPGAPTPRPRTPASNGNGQHANGNGHGALSDDAIRGALLGGPLSTRQLATALGADRGRLNYRLRALARDGIIRSTGRGKGKSVALAGKAPKEAP